MSYTVTYYCPRCGTLAGLEREGYLDDKSVTPYPLEGWSYVAPDEPFGDADGVRFVCGADTTVSWQTPPTADDPDATPAGASGATPDDTGGDGPGDEGDDGEPSELGCGEPFYLSFVRFEEGEEVDPRGPNEQVELAEGSGPTGPGGPDGPTGPDGGGFWG
ncbi:hypothetical protein [Halobaculum sp. MBLA0143]|uniref:hypothetical protein n=1 Tax=Halobaculum sp. MBLA0143 TaxID=3079933 RepID=UPI0035247BCA